MESNQNAHSPVDPVRPVAPYVGGKRNLAKRLVASISETPHDGYAEVFVGMGGVFLRRSHRPKVEVINDASGDVATFFRILQRHYTAFMEMMRFQITTRAEFDRLAATDPDTPTDLERAARFLYLQRTAFGGKVSGRNFGIATERPGRFNIVTPGPLLEDLHARLAGVVIERLDWSEFLRRYDRAGMLFYLDPPYYGSENDYGRSLFERPRFEEMAEQLAGLRGGFIMSINDAPPIRKLFAAFSIEEVPTTYTVSKGGARPVVELIIRSPAGSD